MQISDPDKVNLFRSKVLRKGAIVLLTIAIILSLFLVFFQMFKASMIQSLAQINNEFAEQVDTISGTLQDIINNTAMQMFYSRAGKMLRTNTSFTNAERIAGLRELGNQVSSSTFLTSAMIYNPHTNHIFTSEGGHASDKVAELLLSRTRHGLNSPIKTQINGEECYSFLFFEPSVPQSGSLLLNVRADWYEHQLLGISSGHNSLILTDEGEVLVSGSESLTAGLWHIWPTLDEHLSQDQDHGFVLASNGKSGWMYYRLNNLGWYYLRFFSTEAILPGITRMRNSFVGMLIVVLAFLIIGALHTLFALYMPMRKVHRALLRFSNSNDTVVQQVDKLLESKQEQHLTERMQFLLQGVEDPSIIYPASLILINTTNYEVVRRIIKSSLSEQSLVTKNDFGTAIIISNSTEEEVLKQCCSITHALGCRCLYGSPRDSAPDLAESCRNLLELWKLRFLYAGQQVLSENLFLTNAASVEIQTADTEPLFASLRAGQLEEARAHWKDIFDKIRYQRFNDFRFTVRYIFKRLTTMHIELGLEPPPDSLDLLDDLEDVQVLYEAFDNIFVQITTEQDNRRKKNLDQLAERISERINVGFWDDALSAQHIADEMGMNATYLGRLFRESTGMSISEAIKRTRIENAKMLLQDTSKPIKDVATKVGFANTKYFFVVFKELVGMTPGEFQESQKNLPGTT